MIYTSDDIKIGFKFKDLDDQHGSAELIQTVDKIYKGDLGKRARCLRTRCGIVDYVMAFLVDSLNHGNIVEYKPVYEIY